jgi:2-keto-3-deoxy-6-phosphogluconate aldolase
MDFIFMLTRQDQTVLDGIEVMKEIRDVGLRHVGFKDVGVDKQTLHALNRAVKDAGATSYMEVVSTSPEAAVHSAKVAAEIGIDRLLGGANAQEIMTAIKGSAVAYYPFPGKPVGHPTKLGGSPKSVAEDCRRFLEMGCAGVDLLAYRATEADPIDLVKAARQGLGSAGALICAGSVDSPARIQALKAAGCDAFTIGSAAFDGSFSPRKGRLTSQLRDILAAC